MNAGRWIYLHGFASSPASRKAEFFRLRFATRGRELQVPDVAEGDFENLTISGQLAVVERVAAGDPVSLIGSSMGGYLAALYAARHPEVRRLVLMAPAFDFARRWSEQLGPERTEQWRETGFLEVFHYGDKTERRLRYRLLEDAAQYESWPAVSQPVLIFHGRNDDVVPWRLSEEFARRTPATELRLLESDHELSDVMELMWREVADMVEGD